MLDYHLWRAPQLILGDILFRWFLEVGLAD